MTDSFRQRYIAARRRIIEDDFRELNPMQRKAVLATEGPLLLLAGAGSGKTTVVINRVANLLRYGRGADSEDLPDRAGEAELQILEDAAAGKTPVTEDIRSLCAVEPAAPWRVITITFTNKAADELKTRLEKVLGARALDVWAMTFHGACARILRRDADRLGFPSNFTIYDQADSLSVMKRVLREQNLDEKVWTPKAMLAAAARAKGALLSPEEAVFAAKKSGDIRGIRTAEVCLAYAKRLKAAGAMDFDDLLYFTVRLLTDNPDVLEYYQDKFRYVLIDEYQDTNHLQYLFASLLAGGRRNLCVVGDDDQSIYRFRGATIENILSFEKQYKNARVIRLEQNYRSTGCILDAANAVIANNTERKGKNLWTDKSQGEPVTLYVGTGEEDEAGFVTRTILASRRPSKDFAVLYRTNAQSRVIEQSFKLAGLPYRIFGGTRFFDRAEVKDILAYLCVVANPTDETRLLRIVNEPPRGIGATSLERIMDVAREEEIPLFTAMASASHRPGVSAGKRMEEFCAMITALQELLSHTALDEFYDELLERTGYVRALEAKHSDENLTRIENVQELKTSILRSMEQNGGDLYAFLDEVALYTEMDNYDREADAAVMMTIHSAKGLEFPVVFLVGAEEGLFPGVLSIGEAAEMEEERRLCYVAITRAREKLYITCAAQRMLYGRTTSNLPSRFVEEIPPELLERRGKDLRRRGEYGAVRAPETSLSVTTPIRHGGATASARHEAPAKPRTELSTAEPPKLSPGDRVKHKSFGLGVVEKLTPMGGDALVEIRFEQEGLKKLMLRVAARYMKKQDE